MKEAKANRARHRRRSEGRRSEDASEYLYGRNRRFPLRDVFSKLTYRGSSTLEVVLMKRREEVIATQRRQFIGTHVCHDSFVAESLRRDATGSLDSFAAHCTASGRGADSRGGAVGLARGVRSASCRRPFGGPRHHWRTSMAEKGETVRVGRCRNGARSGRGCRSRGAGGLPAVERGSRGILREPSLCEEGGQQTPGMLHKTCSTSSNRQSGFTS